MNNSDRIDAINVEESAETAEIAQDVQQVAEDHHLIAMFETAAHAEAAQGLLHEAGVAAHQAHTVHYQQDLEESSGLGPWGAVQHLPLPHDDLHELAEGLDRGHAMVVVQADAAQREAVARLLERSGPLDYEAVLERWRNAGWVGRTSSFPDKPPATQPMLPESERVTEVLVQRGMAAGWQFGNTPPMPPTPPAQLVDAPDPVSEVQPVPGYGHPEHEPLSLQSRADLPFAPDTSAAIREFVSDQAVARTRQYYADTARIRVYRR